MSRRPVAPALFTVAVLVTAGSTAAPPDAPRAAESDRFELVARSETTLRLFQRAVIPGPAGAAVATETRLPAVEYLSLRAIDVDAPWQPDSVDVELSAWGAVEVTDPELADRLDGDLTVANVRGRIGPGYVKLGRQIAAGGAARFARFDGASAGARADVGLGVDGYAGLEVLPRWDARPGYHHLGSAADSLLRNPDAFEDPGRGGNRVLGARGYFLEPELAEVGVSFHDEREASELGRQNVGVDAHLTPADELAASGQVLVDTDSRRVADLRASVDVYPVEPLTLTGEYLDVDPALLLSRQSVLSVFTASRFRETGGEATYRFGSRWSVSSAGYIQRFDDGSRGTRSRFRLRVRPDRRQRLFVQLSGGRVSERQNGYYSGRAALRYRILPELVTTADHYTYIYDEPINGVSRSFVQGATAEWNAFRGLFVLLGGSVATTPLAESDLQALLRLVYDLDHCRRGGASCAAW